MTLRRPLARTVPMNSHARRGADRGSSADEKRENQWKGLWSGCEDAWPVPSGATVVW